MLSKALGTGLSALCGGPYSSKAPTAEVFYPTQKGLRPLTGSCGGT